MPVLGRVVTAMATPFTDDGGLDLDGAQRLATHLADHGTDTVLVGGTTGESPTLRGDELRDLTRAVQDAVGDRAKIMVGTGSNDTRKTIEATDKATALGADAILVVTPYYNKPSQRALIAHFTDVARSTDRPVILYDIPGRTSREIEIETLVELSQVDNIAGVKDACSDLAKAGQVSRRTQDAPGGFEIYSGDDAVNLPLLAVGAAGFVSVASHLIGDALQDMATVFDSDPAKAREIHLRSLPVWEALFAEPNPAPLKGALNRLGLPGGPVRLPLVDAEEDTIDALMSALEPFDVGPA
ncbi:MAG: 4-hydroxy-tetrahydrodipicolinate synthase [Nitriliruptorales bacterium]|nr:4-hydroxy-tetrahydrodipicolinate synthase [Nitriliruptorales bacterium]